MMLSKKSVLRKGATLALMSAIVFGSAIPAYAIDDSTVVISPGEISGGDITFNTFAPVDVTGVEQTTDATFEFEDVVDARGTGLGWSTTLKLTQFKTGSGATLHTLPAESVQVTGKSTATGGSGTITTADEDVFLDGASAVTLVSAGAGNGMGTTEIGDLTVTLTIPADVYAGTYTSDATITAVTATP